MKKFRAPKTKELVLLAEFYKETSNMEAAEMVEGDNIIVLQDFISDTPGFMGDIMIVIPPSGSIGTLVFEVRDRGLLPIDIES